MIDLGTLGGTIASAQCGNHRGQIIGMSFLAGNQTVHPFLWERGALRDLGTLGGDNGLSVWINDVGDVVGEADVTGSQTHHAFLWRKGVMTDLGTLGTQSHASAVNAKRQVIGDSNITGRTEPPFRHAFLWEDGGPMVDLNTLIPANSGFELVSADNINERGEIHGVGVPARCFPDLCGHNFLLIPCAESESGSCDDNGGRSSQAKEPDPMHAVSDSTIPLPRSATAEERVPTLRATMANRYDAIRMRTRQH
jgi:probable HAF family extracellular repeat protein